MDPTVVGALLGFAAAALGAVLVWLVGQHRILAEHVTRERAKWRKKIRKKALEVHDALMLDSRSERDLLRLQMQFRLLLSPLDKRDREILCCITSERIEKDAVTQAKKFAYRVSRLLKHDWERAKLEAGFPVPGWLFRANSKLRDDSGKACKCEKSDNSKLRTEWSDFWAKYECRRLNTWFLVILLGLIATVVWWSPWASSATGDDALARYDTCEATCRHGIAPVQRARPAYRHMRDADGEGVVCE